MFDNPDNLPTPIPVVFPRIVSGEMNEWLTQQCLVEEVRATLFSFNYGKSLGPDGFTSEFLKMFWSEVKGTVM